MPYIGNTIRAADDYRLIDDISSGFNGSATSFALQVAGSAPVPFPKSPQQVLISVNGVIQEPDPTGASGFNLVGTNIVFSSAPTNGHAFFGIIYATADYLNSGGNFPTGSLGAPSITFVGDEDTGIYRKGSGSIGFVSNSTEIANTDSNGITISTGNLILGDSGGTSSDRVVLGASSDFELYHNGSHSFIDRRAGGTGDIYVRLGTDNALIAKTDGAVELYHDNSKRFETSSPGATVTGIISATSHFHPTLDSASDLGSSALRFRNQYISGSGMIDFLDNGKIKMGNDDDLQIFHDGGNTHFANTTGTFKIKGDDIHLQNASGSEDYITAAANGNVELYHDNNKKFETISTGVTVTGDVNITDDLVINSSNAQQILRDFTSSSDSDISGLLSGSSFGTLIQGAPNGHHVIALRENDTSDSFVIVSGGGNYQADNTYDTVVARFFSSGTINIPDNGTLKFGTGNDLQLIHDGTDSMIINNGSELFIYTVGDHDVKILADSQNAVIAKPDGAVELYYDNSKKFETTATGADFTVASGGQVNIFGSGSDNGLRISGPQSASSACLFFNTNHNNVSGGTDQYTIQCGGANHTLMFKHTDTTGNVVFELDDTENVRIPQDNKALKIGAGQDLQLRHTGTNSVIQNNTGVLYISGDDVRIVNNAINESGLKFTANGAVEILHNNSKVFETRDSGVHLTGDASVGHIVEGDLRFKKAGDGTTRIQFRGDEQDIIFTDDYKATFGSSADLKIFHDGSHSFIQNAGTGDLVIYGTGENLAKFKDDGAVELYYDNTLSLYTTSAGFRTSGQGEFDGGIRLTDTRKALFGDSGDLEIYHDGSNSYIDCPSSGVGHLIVRADDFYLKGSNDEIMIFGQENGKVGLYHNNSEKVKTTSDGLSVNNNILSWNEGDGGGTNVDHIWHDDGQNAFYFISDGSVKQTTGSAKLICNSVVFGGNNPAVDANRLNDYEEGTHTPTFANLDVPAHVTTNYFNFTKVGRLVHIDAKFTVSSSINDNSGFGFTLPFTQAGSRETVFFAMSNRSGSEKKPFGGKMHPSQSTVYLFEQEGLANATYSDFSGNEIYLAGTYEST